MPRRPRSAYRLTQFQKTLGPRPGTGSESWHYKWNGAYVPRSGDKEIKVPADIAPYVRIYDTYYNPPRGLPSSMKPSVRYHIHFKGTNSKDATLLRQWKENYQAAFRRHRIPEWDRAIDYVRDRYGYDSRNGRHFSHPDGVHYTGFSRGSALSMYLGGSGYGLGAAPFPAYPPAFGSDHHKVHDWYALWVHDWFLTEHAPGNMEASQSGMDQSTAVYGKRPADQTAVTDGGKKSKNPHHVEEVPTDGVSMWMPAHDGHPDSIIKKYEDGFWYYMNEDGTRGPAVEGQGFGNYDDRNALADEFGDDDDHPMDVDETPSTPITPSTGVSFRGLGFSGLVSTLLNPVTGRILNYKGIRRKRKLSTLEQYSPFWKEQSHTPRSVFVAPSQA